MPKKGEIASVEAPDEVPTDSVFDFLYHDSRRVGSFLAQLDENGLLTQIRQSEHFSKGAKRGFSANVGASTPITGGANAGFQVTPKEGSGEASERIYDPFWANARELLNALTINNMIQRDISTAALGSVVLVSGALNIIDLGMIKLLWGLPSIQKAVHSGGQTEPTTPLNRHERRGQAKQRQSEQRNPDTELLLEVLPMLPHTLNVLVGGERGSAWGTLAEDHLVGRGSDLILKHGATIPGDWQLLGILDAQPDFSNLAQVAQTQEFDLSALLLNSVVGQVSNMLAPIIQLMLGRPTGAFGVTPLMIFREIGVSAAA